MQEDSPLLLAVAGENVSLMEEITIPKTGVSFILTEKKMNIFFKRSSLLDIKLPSNYNLVNRENCILKTKTVVSFGINYLFI